MNSTDSPELPLHLAHQVEDRPLHRHVERRRDLVGDQRPRGSPARARASATRWRWPPESCAGSVSARAGSRWTSSSSSRDAVVAGGLDRSGRAHRLGDALADRSSAGRGASTGPGRPSACAVPAPAPLRGRPRRPSIRIRPPATGAEPDGRAGERGLARAGLADEADRLAAGTVGITTVDGRRTCRRGRHASHPSSGRSPEGHRLDHLEGCSPPVPAAIVGRRIVVRQRAARCAPGGRRLRRSGHPGIVGSGRSRSRASGRARRRPGPGCRGAARPSREVGGGQRPRRWGRRTSPARGRRTARRARCRG